MGLRDFKAATAVVKSPDGDEFAVRGLSFDEVHELLREHKPAATALYDRFAEQDLAECMGDLLLAAMDLAPGLVADVIATGIVDADVPDLAERRGLIRALPIAVQIDALEMIGARTFNTEGGLKNLIGLVIQTANGTTSPDQTPQA